MPRPRATRAPHPSIIGIDHEELVRSVGVLDPTFERQIRLLEPPLELATAHRADLQALAPEDAELLEDPGVSEAIHPKTLYVFPGRFLSLEGPDSSQLEVEPAD